jgi:AcrR family transcriptional regulator
MSRAGSAVRSSEESGSRAKERIVAAAVELFSERGYHGTGVAEIGARAKVGRGALYHHINSKEELLFRVLSACVDEKLVTAAERTRRSPGTTEEKIGELSRALMTDIVSHRAEWTIYFHDADRLTGDYRKEIQRRRDHYEDIWLDVLAEGKATGEVRDIDPVIVKGILGMHNYSYMWMSSNGRLSAEQVSDVYCELIVRGLIEGR